MADGDWVVLMTHPMGAGTSPVDAAALEMLHVESELVAKGIEVGWDPFRPGEGFQGFFGNVAWPRPLHMLVQRADLAEAQEIIRALHSAD